ncbi:MAG: glycosyltransferase [Candidatus Adiutrix sp.]|jgi:glycosyltransferase involved in cell wall biosynthesis|nr:glycosyltransferase [Candidatus Adiutrix sp.]
MLFSIVIPAYNAEATLAEAVESARLQSLSDDFYEILIIDGGSTDGTATVMAELGKTANNVHLFKNPYNVGPGAARNRALEEARGEYITFLDADDLLRSDALECYRLALLASKPEVLFSSILKIGPFGEAVLRLSSDGWHIPGEFKSLTIRGRRGFRAFGAVYKRSFLDQKRIRFTEKGFYEDIEFVTRAVLWADSIEALPEDLYYWRITRGSATASLSPGKIDDAVAAVERMPLIFLENNSLERYLDDWREFAERFTGLTWLRLKKYAGHDSSLKSRLPERIESSEVFRKYGLTEPLIQALRHSEESTLDEPACPDPELLEAVAGAVVMVANADYQVRNFVAVARRLDEMAIKNVICDISDSKPFSIARAISDEEAAAYSDIRLFRFDCLRICPLFLNARAYLVAGDWGFFRLLVLTLKQRQIPVIGFYEGINDDFLLEPPAPPVKKHLPYRHPDHLLLPGEYYRSIYSKPKNTVVGLPTVRRLLGEEICFPARPRAVINVNFSYGVLEDARQAYLESAVAACRQVGLDFVVSQHPADQADLSPLAVSNNSIYEEIKSGSLLISRFSTCILEALALGKPAIYHNPHGEKFPKYQENPMGAFQVSVSTASLAGALERTLADLKAGVDIRNRARAFLQAHANIFAEEPPEHYAAGAVKEIVEANEESFQERILHLSPGHDGLPQGRRSEAPFWDQRLLNRYKNAAWMRKVIIMLLLDRPRLKARLRKRSTGKLVRALIKLIPE